MTPPRPPAKRVDFDEGVDKGLALPRRWFGGLSVGDGKRRKLSCIFLSGGECR